MKRPRMARGRPFAKRTWVGAPACHEEAPGLTNGPLAGEELNKRRTPRRREKLNNSFPGGHQRALWQGKCFSVNIEQSDGLLGQNPGKRGRVLAIELVVLEHWMECSGFSAPDAGEGRRVAG